MPIIGVRIPQKELRASVKRYEDGATVPAWDLYLDGDLVASEYVSETEAQMELDLAAWYALFGDAPLSPEKLITDEALGLALAIFNRCFTALHVQEKARTALEHIIKASIYTIGADGDLRVLASSGRGKKTSYAVTARRTPRDEAADGQRASYHVTMACECRDFYARAHAHGGICKHVAARLLLFLAQLGVGALKHLRDALDTREPLTAPQNAPITEPTLSEPDAEGEGASAFLAIDASDLAAAVFLITRAVLPIEVRAIHGMLHLVAGTTHLAIPCLDGDGAAAVRLHHDAATALYEQLRPNAKSIGALNVFVEPSDGSLFLCGQGEADFAAQASGTTIPIATPPEDQLIPVPAPDIDPGATPENVADAPAIEALYELFTLLERHEPEWYQRRHYRIAHAVLSAAGRHDCSHTGD